MTFTFNHLYILAFGIFYIVYIIIIIIIIHVYVHSDKITPRYLIHIFVLVYLTQTD